MIPRIPFRLPRVYPILDTATLGACGASCISAARALIGGGAGILQYRHKGFWNRERFAEALGIAGLCGDAGIPFIVNDRADYAAILRREGWPAGLHIGQEDLRPADARRVIGEDAILGFSTHNLSQMTLAQTEPVDYVAFGPVFATVTKENPDPVTGADALREIRRLTDLPLVAIGGVTLENARQCWSAGADSVAVISALIPTPFSPEAATERMRAWQRLATL